MDILPTTKSGFLDVLMIPVRGIIQPLFDSYRKKEAVTTEITIPAWAVSDIKNTPIPYQVNHRYDFGNGGVYGPPDMPVSAGIVNTPGIIQVQQSKEGKQIEFINGFYNGPQEYREIFVHMPFSLPTDLPCSTSMLKY